jgi:NADH-quinone oxidoreductase subunit N
MVVNIDAMMPWLVLSAGILLTLLVSVIRVETRRPAQGMAFLTLIATIVFGVAHFPEQSTLLFQGAIEISKLTQAMLILLSGLGAMFIVGASGYLTREKLHLSDYYHLLLILILGASVMVCSRDLIVSFIALEVMSLPAYTLAGFRRNDSRSNEAAIKYFILGGAIGAVFLMGASFLYGATGSTQMDMIFTWSQKNPGVPILFWTGHALVMIAFLFKVAAVPFHFWKPDVYEGAPTPVTGVMATIVTAAAFIALVRLVHLVDFTQSSWADYAVATQHWVRTMAGLSLVVGSAIMVTQKNLKRMMAYSSVTHTGYLLLGVLGTFGAQKEIYPVLIYLVGYTIMSTGVFILLSQSETKADMGVELLDLTGLLKRAPFMTFLWSIFLFSMAGMPFTVGFFTKYFVFIASLNGGEVGIVVLAAICTVVSAYAYLRPIALMVMREADPGASQWVAGLGSQIVAVSAAAAVVFLGTLPNAMVHYLKGIPLIH